MANPYVPSLKYPPPPTKEELLYEILARVKSIERQLSNRIADKDDGIYGEHCDGR